MTWALPETPAERLRLALGYPYEAPEAGYLLRDGRALPLGEADFSARVAVLAHGSNRAPEQLARKFPTGELPVTCGWLHDHAVVYAARLSRYGACPSLLRHRPGAAVRLSVTWLTPVQLEVMHATEGAYAFGSLEARFEVEEGPAPLPLHLYHSEAGCLALDGEAVALAARPARGCDLPALAQAAVLEAIRGGQEAGAAGLEAFLLAMIDDAARREALAAALAATALPNPLPGFRALVPAPARG